MTRAEAVTLVIGCGYTLVTSLDGHRPAGSLVVVEEPALIERQKGGLRERAARLPVVARLMPFPYVDGIDARALAAALPAGVVVDAVVPGTDEMSAVAAAAVAAELGVPGASTRAAGILRDKLELRATAEAAGLRNPRWTEVTGAAGVAAAVRDLRTADVVLKPATRSGSQGVLVLDGCDDLTAAWRESSAAALPPAGGRSGSRFLVEERVRGPEVSVECLVAAGDVVFANVTAKRVTAGRHPVEVGHALPAAVDAVVEKELRASMQALADATGFRFGVLHGEWILAAGAPVLVECAGRIPGDEITHLLSLAYGVPFVARYAQLMTGAARAVDDPRGWTSAQGAAVTFLTPRPGRVVEVAGLDDVQQLPRVRDAEVEVAPGDSVGDLRASADRVGFVVAVGADASEAARNADDAAARVVVSTVTAL